MMSEHDKQLVERSKSMSYMDIREEDAESEEGRAMLHRIIMRDYHMEEYQARLL